MGIINELNELSALRAKIKQLEGRIEYCKEQSMMIPGPMWGEEKYKLNLVAKLLLKSGLLNSSI